MIYRTASIILVLTAAFFSLLVLDPSGTYFGLSTAPQYVVVGGVFTSAALWAMITSRPRAVDVYLVLGAALLLVLGLIRSDLENSESALRVFLIPYVLACAYVGGARFAKPVAFQYIFSVAGVAVGCALLAWRFAWFLPQNEQLFHEEVFFLAPLMIAAWRSKMRWRGLIVILFSTAAFISSNKLTSLIVLAITSAVLSLEFAESRFWRKRSNMFVTVGGAVGLLGLVGISMWFVITNGNSPTGSVDVREVTYMWRWNEFLVEPILGGARSGVASIYVAHKQFAIPSHSDVLDILAFSGLLGLMVFAVPLLGSLRACIREEQWEILGLISAIIVTSVFNPLLYQPAFLAILAFAIFFSRRIS